MDWRRAAERECVAHSNEARNSVSANFIHNMKLYAYVYIHVYTIQTKPSMNLYYLPTRTSYIVQRTYCLVEVAQ